MGEALSNHRLVDVFPVQVADSHTTIVRALAVAFGPWLLARRHLPNCFGGLIPTRHSSTVRGSLMGREVL
jgi:hypothetical protein